MPQSRRPSYASICIRIIKCSTQQTIHFLTLASIFSKQFLPKYNFPANWRKHLLRALRRLVTKGILASSGYSKLVFYLQPAKRDIQSSRPKYAKRTIQSPTSVSLTDLGDGMLNFHDVDLEGRVSSTNYTDLKDTMSSVHDADLRDKLEKANRIISSDQSQSADKFNLASILIRRLIKDQDCRTKKREKLALIERQEEIIAELGNTMKKANANQVNYALGGENSLKILAYLEGEFKRYEAEVVVLRNILDERMNELISVEITTQEMNQSYDDQAKMVRLLEQELEQVKVCRKVELEEANREKQQLLEAAKFEGSKRIEAVKEEFTKMVHDWHCKEEALSVENKDLEAKIMNYNARIAGLKEAIMECKGKLSNIWQEK